MIKRIKAWLIFRDEKKIKLKHKYRILEDWGEPINYIGQPHSGFSESGLAPREIIQKWSIADLTFDPQIDRAYNNDEFKFITLFDTDYPQDLKNLYCPPMFLFYRGDLSICNNCVGIIGTRKVSNYGVRVVNNFVRELAFNNLTIVSGLSFGVDAEAHRATLKAEGKTIAILPGSLDKVYPDANRKLADQIAETGLVLSEYPPGQTVERWHFPERNRLISGISKAVIMVEGGVKSGALITARFALEQNKLLYAVPGDIYRDVASAPNTLISQGATPALSAKIILEDLGIDSKQEGSVPNLPVNNPIYNCLKESGEPIDMDTLIELTGQNFGELAANLLELEMSDIIRRIAGGRYTIIS